MTIRLLEANYWLQLYRAEQAKPRRRRAVSPKQCGIRPEENETPPHKQKAVAARHKLTAKQTSGER
ncbi:MAG: hypothetical protein NVS9B14_12890 [Candidatus Acidiferrum sp.]